MFVNRFAILISKLTFFFVSNFETFFFFVSAKQKFKVRGRFFFVPASSDLHFSVSKQQKILWGSKVKKRQHVFECLRLWVCVSVCG